MYGNNNGVSELVHPDGVYDDPKGGIFREKLYPKLKFHFQFENELNLFEGTNDHGRMRFSINAYSNQETSTFDTVSNLFYPTTLDECYEDTVSVDIPGIKDDNGNLNINGHPGRVVTVGRKELEIFAKLFDGSEEWRRARLPVLHAQVFTDILEKFLDCKNKLDCFGDKIIGTTYWTETGAKNDGMIEENVNFPETAAKLIYSGSLIGVANPLFKATRSICKQNSDFDSINVSIVKKYYLQRCKYTLGCENSEYLIIVNA